MELADAPRRFWKQWKNRGLRGQQAFKIAIKIFYCCRKGKKEGRRKGGREAESWKEGEREGLWFTHTKRLAKGKMRA